MAPFVRDEDGHAPNVKQAVPVRGSDLDVLHLGGLRRTVASGSLLRRLRSTVRLTQLCRGLLAEPCLFDQFLQVLRIHRHSAPAFVVRE